MPEDKYIDESWKETASEEKERLEKTEGAKHEENKDQKLESAGQENLAMTFLHYLTSLAFQTMIFLGEIPNPATNQADKNLDQAKLLIDTLLMLREKTQGNLSKQESDFLNGSLYELQMKYVELTK